MGSEVLTREQALEQIADERVAESRAGVERREADERAEAERLESVQTITARVHELDDERAELKPKLKSALRQVVEVATRFSANAEERRQAYNALLKLEPDTRIVRDRQWAVGLEENSLTSETSERGLVEQAVAALRMVGGV